MLFLGRFAGELLARNLADRHVVKFLAALDHPVVSANRRNPKPLSMASKRSYFLTLTRASTWWHRHHFTPRDFVAEYLARRVEPLPWLTKAGSKQMNRGKAQLRNLGEARRYMEQALARPTAEERVAAALPLLTGVSSGELLHIQAGAVDFEAGVIHVRSSETDDEDDDDIAELAEGLQPTQLLFRAIDDNTRLGVRAEWQRKDAPRAPNWLRSVVKRVCRDAGSQADGRFEIAGLAGNHSLRIVLDGYLARANELVIPEEEDVEIGNVVAVRLPRQNGILFPGAEDYLPVDEITLIRKDNVIQEEIGLLSFPRKVSTYSIKNTDAIPTVPGPFVTIFDRSGEAPVLVSVPRREVAVETYYPDSDMFNPDWEKRPRLLKYTEAVDDRQVIAGGTILRSFQGNIGAIYCYIRRTEGEIRNFMEATPVAYTSSKAWCFRVGDGGSTSRSVIVTSPDTKAPAPGNGSDVGLSCTDQSFCPDHPDTVAGFIARICDNSFTVDNVSEIEAALIAGRLSKAELPWIFNVYGASYGYKFEKRPQLNTFFYGDDSAKWLPPACLRFRNSLASMSGLTKGQWAAFKAIKKLLK